MAQTLTEERKVAWRIQGTGPDPAHWLVILKKVGQGKILHRTLPPGQVFRRPLLTSADSYEAYAVSADGNLRHEFSRKYQAGAQTWTFTLHFKLHFRVKSVERLGLSLSGQDPLERLQEEVASVLSATARRFSWEVMKREGEDFGLCLREAEATDGQGERRTNFHRLQSFAGDLGLELRHLDVLRSLTEPDLADEKKVRANEQQKVIARSDQGLATEREQLNHELQSLRDQHGLDWETAVARSSQALQGMERLRVILAAEAEGGAQAIHQSAGELRSFDAIHQALIEVQGIQASLAGVAGSGEPPKAGAAGTSEPDPPRSAYARLDAPEVVVAEVEMEVMIGLAKEPSPGVAGAPIIRPASSVGPYTLSLQLVADGFRPREGETLRRGLSVTAEAPYPTATFHLTPEPQGTEVRARTLQAFYEVGGQTIGMAVRPVAVVRSPDLLAGTEKPASLPGVALAIPTDAPPPDLEIRILLDPDHPGRLLWTFNTPHQGIILPDQGLPTEIGGDPKSFTRLLIDRVNSKDGKLGIYPLLAGIGRDIANQMPDELWDLLRAVAAKSMRTPDVLILSQEPYVPWELAKLDGPLFDPDAPPFLAAQVNLGRWVLPRRQKAPSRRQRPPQPPPTELAIHSVAVVSGIYDMPGWNRLLEAEGEADDLEKKLKAQPVTATVQEVLRCLEGDPPADLLHFAVHGIYDPNGAQDGLMLTDGATLDPFQVGGSDLVKVPFVFLNACQVGAGNQVLGDYAGMAAEFLAAGASGVIAPLWSVKDTLAREIALAFYAATENGAVGPAAALRDARKGFQAGRQAQSATYLAYQFFGHPTLKLRFAIP
ncbi:MAG: hypothetical protein QOE95_1863 [Gaiellaceae bacterium]|nr:hypothetical protein [Gaiellaceae bacterium]